MKSLAITSRDVENLSLMKSLAITSINVTFNIADTAPVSAPETENFHFSTRLEANLRGLAHFLPKFHCLSDGSPTNFINRVLSKTQTTTNFHLFRQFSAIRRLPH